LRATARLRTGRGDAPAHRFKTVLQFNGDGVGRNIVGGQGDSCGCGNGSDHNARDGRAVCANEAPIQYSDFPPRAEPLPAPATIAPLWFDALGAAPDWKPALRHLRKVDPEMASMIKKVGPCTLSPRPDRFLAL